MKKIAWKNIAFSVLMVWAVGCIVTCMSGCSNEGDAGSSTVTNSSAAGSGEQPATGQRNLPSVSAPGAGPQTAAGAGDIEVGGGAGTASPPSNANSNSNERMIGGRMRRLPAVGVPGGGSLPPPSASQPNNSVVSGGMANGLFPQGGGGGASRGVTGSGSVGGSFASVSGFGALFPQGSGGGSVANSGGGAGGGNTRGRNLPQASAPGSPSPFGQAPSGQGANANNSGNADVSASGSLLDQASALFKAGKETEAVRMLYGHMLMDDNAYTSYPMMWYPGIEEPRPFFRWGIGISYSPHRDHSGIPPLIGDEPPGATAARGSDDLGTGSDGGGNTGGSTVSNSRYGKVDTSVPAGMLMYYTGDYIERLYKRLNDRRTVGDGYYGKILRSMPERGEARAGAQQAAPSQLDQARARRNLPQASAGGGGGLPGGGGAAAPEIGGAGGDSAGGSGAGNLLSRFNTNQDASEPSGSVVGTLLPGVMCIGEGKKEELLERAAAMNLDAVLIFDVKVGESRKNYFSTVILRVYNPKDPKTELAKTKGLRSSQVMEDRKSTSEKNDPVELALDQLFKDFADANFKASEMPELQPEHVEGRVDALLANPTDKLRSAVEIMGYFRNDLLGAERAQAALDELLGGGGQLLMSGKQDARRDFITQLLDESGSPIGPDGIR